MGRKEQIWLGNGIQLRRSLRISGLWKWIQEKRWLKALGNHIRQLIETKGYKSPYEFWVNNIGDQISRTTLNYILTGAVDVKATTLRKIARALGVSPKDILAF